MKKIENYHSLKLVLLVCSIDLLDVLTKPKNLNHKSHYYSDVNDANHHNHV